VLHRRNANAMPGRQRRIALASRPCSVAAGRGSPPVGGLRSAGSSLSIACVSAVASRPSFGGQRTAGACAMRSRSGHRAGLSVLRRPAHCRDSTQGPGTRACAGAARCRMLRAALNSSQIRSCSCCTAMLLAQAQERPPSNPSVERTNNGGPRLAVSPAVRAPLFAAHLQR
jgi:hypothetical protein